jgi:hypothetical protein
MSDYDTTEVEGTDLEQRDVRALTECMTVLPEGGNIYTVVGENGRTYRVDAREDRCTCRDYEYNLPTGDGRETCKHRARVAFAAGERAIPAWIDSDAVDDLLGEQLTAGSRVAATDGGIIDASDDGEILDESDGRPDDCDCGGWNAATELPCWPCYRDGFEVPASAEEEV